MTNAQLILEAKKAREKAYCPYSHYSVGAALLTEDGKVFHGCNVENASYGTTNCAERTAFFKAISEGDTKFTKIAIVGGTVVGTDGNEMCSPCGICRQVMMEFCNPETFKIILANGENAQLEYTLKEMLPFGFGPGNLER